MSHKFDNDISETLYADHFPTDEIGNVGDFGWYGLFKTPFLGGTGGWILFEDSQGFVDSAAYGSADELSKAWNCVVVQAMEYYADSDDES